MITTVLNALEPAENKLTQAAGTPVRLSLRNIPNDIAGVWVHYMKADGHWGSVDFTITLEIVDRFPDMVPDMIYNGAISCLEDVIKLKE